MKSYLVGGAVRDELLDLPVADHDYVVVGSTPEEMLAQGYRPVGKDFPVFLHPETHEEYALARIERKIGPGHQGFECHASPEVTLEQDLARRDLTINAIAKDAGGELIDPHGGQADLKARVLRHISPAFSEDPLRILRLAEFKARLYHKGFEVHPDTTACVMQMVNDNQLNELAPERILAEVNKALLTRHPHVFFSYLQDIGAAKHLWPEISALGLQRLEKGVNNNPPVEDSESRFALLVIDQDREQIETLCSRLRTTRSRLELAIMIADHLLDWMQCERLTPKDILTLLRKLDAPRRIKRFQHFNNMARELTPLVRHDDDYLKATGTKTLPETSAVSLHHFWQTSLDVVCAVKASTLQTSATGRDLGDAIRQEQLAQVTALRQTFDFSSGHSLPGTS